MSVAFKTSTAARVLGVLAIVGHVAASIVYLLLPALEVTYPALYGFAAAWVVVLGLGLWWLRSHPWRTVAVVVLGLVLVTVVRIYGEQNFGWRG